MDTDGIISKLLNQDEARVLLDEAITARTKAMEELELRRWDVKVAVFEAREAGITISEIRENLGISAARVHEYVAAVRFARMREEQEKLTREWLNRTQAEQAEKALEAYNAALEAERNSE